MFNVKEEDIKSQSLIDSELYPTPDSVIEHMVEPWLVDGRYGKKSLPFRKVLDPSGGLGNILKYVKDRFIERYNNIDLYACEINDQARSVLQGHGFTVLEADFFAFSGDGLRFGAILMNPPFSNGVKHLLHAWNVVASPGTRISCLLNAETLKNPHTKERQLLLGIIEEHGEWRSIGRPFAQSERTTNVEVALVTLKKPDEEPAVDFSGAYEQDLHDVETLQFGTNLPVTGDKANALVARYDAAIRTVKRIYEAGEELRFHTRMDGTYDKEIGLETLVSASRFQVKDIADVIQEIKRHFWKEVFSQMGMERFMTSAVREQFDAFIEANQKMAFTASNIRKVLESVMLAGEEIVKQCILSTFDTFTGFHEKNRVHHEGWKTNKAWKLNEKKIIYPRAMNQSDWGSFRLGYGNDKPLNDLDIVMCHLSGTAVNDITYMRDAIKAHCETYHEQGLRHDEKIESTFFYVRCYKKGTVHIYPKDKKLWNELNITVAKYRNWIGDGS